MSYLILDIETGAAGEAALEMAKNQLKPNSNIKDPKKKEANLDEKKVKLLDRAELLDSSPITCVGGKTKLGTYCVTSFKHGYETELLEAGIETEQKENERDLLISLASYANSSHFDEETTLVTFNGYFFDLPKIRNAYARNSLQVPELFSPGWAHVDLMLRYAKHFSIKRDQYISMDEVVQTLGIATGGKQISGAEFPKMIEDGRQLEAVLYNVMDCLLTEQIFFRIG